LLTQPLTLTNPSARTLNCRIRVRVRVRIRLRVRVWIRVRIKVRMRVIKLLHLISNPNSTLPLTLTWRTLSVKGFVFDGIPLEPVPGLGVASIRLFGLKGFKWVRVKVQIAMLFQKL
jgi:hypothetical protein